LYTFINSSENNIIFSKIYKKCCIIDYTSLGRERGLAYYCIRKNGRQEIVRNPHYKATPNIVELTADTPLINSDIEISETLYESLKYKMDFLIAKLAG
jgi:hypothetical protein